MNKEIVVTSKSKAQGKELSSLLREEGFTATHVPSISALERHLEKETCLVVIIDIDSLRPDNRTVRRLTIRHPGTYFLGLSKNTYNPELREAICYHIYACLRKPVDPDELFYWLRCISEEESDHQEAPSNSLA